MLLEINNNLKSFPEVQFSLFLILYTLECTQTQREGCHYKI